MFVGRNVVRCGLGVWALSGAVAFGIVAGSFGQDVQARPVSKQVKRACVRDYRRYCRTHRVGSSQLRECMRSNGKRLSERCVKALADAGELSQKDMELRKASNQ